MVELEDASPIGVGRRTRDAAEPGAGPAGHAAIEKARPAHLVGMLVQIEKQAGGRASCGLTCHELVAEDDWSCDAESKMRRQGCPR